MDIIRDSIQLLKDKRDPAKNFQAIRIAVMMN